MSNMIDSAYDRLLKIEPEIVAALKGKPNESDTRLKILDRFLFEILEWKREAVFTEPSTDSGYIHYDIVKPSQGSVRWLAPEFRAEGTEGSWTLRWREPDSNHRSR
jgi:hypothetical protein